MPRYRGFAGRFVESPRMTAMRQPRCELARWHARCTRGSRGAGLEVTAMRRILSALAATLLAGAAGAQMNAGTTPADPSVTVVEINRVRNEMTVRDAAGRQQTLKLNDATRFERPGVAGAPGSAIRMDDVVVGDRILATDPARRGDFTPRIQVLPPGAVGAPGTVRPGANPAAGVNQPGVSNPASPPGQSRPGMRPASPPPGVNQPGVSNPAAPPPPPAGGGGSGSK
jgi:hypothetical protein